VRDILSWWHSREVNLLCLFNVRKASLFHIIALKSIRKADAGRGGMAVIFMVIDDNHCWMLTEAASGFLFGATQKKIMTVFFSG
jgi:hypothetical protein